MLADFITVIEQSLGKKAQIDFRPMQPGDVKETFADISETTRLTGYQPATSITDGLPKFIEWYKGYYNV
jgi:UDP-glucuronate 4-epimerase